MQINLIRKNFAWNIFEMNSTYTTKNMKVSRRTHTLLFVACMVFIMAFFMSGFMIVFNAGFCSNFFSLWMRNFGLSYLVAFPIAAVAVPLIRKLLNRYTEIDG